MLRTTGNLPGAGAVPVLDGKVIVAPRSTPSSIRMNCWIEYVFEYVVGTAAAGFAAACDAAGRARSPDAASAATMRRTVRRFTE
jgi:hypothetical protein